MKICSIYMKLCFITFLYTLTLSHGYNSFLVIREQFTSQPGFSATQDRALRGQCYCLVKMKLRVQPSTQYPVPTISTNIGRKSPRDFIAATENGQFRKPRRARPQGMVVRVTNYAHTFTNYCLNFQTITFRFQHN